MRWFLALLLAVMTHQASAAKFSFAGLDWGDTQAVAQTKLSKAGHGGFEPTNQPLGLRNSPKESYANFSGQVAAKPFKGHLTFSSGRLVRVQLSWSDGDSTNLRVIDELFVKRYGKPAYRPGPQPYWGALRGERLEVSHSRHNAHGSSGPTVYTLSADYVSPAHARDQVVWGAEARAEDRARQRAIDAAKAKLAAGL